MDDFFAGRLRQLCNDYYKYMETLPCPVSSYTRMNSLLGGTRKPTMDELLKISEVFDVSINYLLTRDKMLPSLHMLKNVQAEKIRRKIEELRPEPDLYG